MINFNEEISKELINEYAGSERKKTVLLKDGKKYLLKFPDPIRERDNDLSYINNAISEYLGCKIVKSLGLPVQEVVLGEYTDEKGRTKIACACQDVRRPGEQMHPIQTINLSSLDDTAKNESSIKNAMDFCDHFGLIKPNELKEFYYDMFVADAFLGNTDRHNGNWAILSDEMGNVRISPIFDCGSSLSPMLAEKDLNETNALNEALSVHSVIIGENGKRIQYSTYLKDTNNKDLHAAIERIVPRINVKEITEFIEKIPCISDKRKEFYKSIVGTRYDKVMLPTYERVARIGRDTVDGLTKDISDEKLFEYKELVQNIKGSKDFELLKNPQTEAIYMRVSTNKAIVYDKERQPITVVSLKQSKETLKELAAAERLAISRNKVINMDMMKEAAKKTVQHIGR